MTCQLTLPGALAEKHAHCLWRFLMPVWGIVPACQLMIMLYFAKEGEVLDPFMIWLLLTCIVSPLGLAFFYHRGWYTPQQGLVFNSLSGVPTMALFQIYTGGLRSPYMVGPLLHTVCVYYAYVCVFLCAIPSIYLQLQ